MPKCCSTTQSESDVAIEKSGNESETIKSSRLLKDQKSVEKSPGTARKDSFLHFYLCWK